MREKILKEFKESIKVKEDFLEGHLDMIIEVAKAIACTFNDGNKILLFGNGGSSTDASHIAAEFVNRFVTEGRNGEGRLLTTPVFELAVANTIHGTFFEEGL